MFQENPIVRNQLLLTLTFLQKQRFGAAILRFSVTFASLHHKKRFAFVTCERVTS
jgi:hypothetical protein